MLYLQNGDRIVTIETVTSLHHMYWCRRRTFRSSCVSALHKRMNRSRCRLGQSRVGPCGDTYLRHPVNTIKQSVRGDGSLCQITLSGCCSSPEWTLDDCVTRWIFFGHSSLSAARHKQEGCMQSLSVDPFSYDSGHDSCPSPSTHVQFLPRGAMLARYQPGPRVCLQDVGVLSKPMNRSSWFWHRGFLQPVLLRVIRKCGYLQKLRYTSLWDFVQNSGI